MLSTDEYKKDKRDELALKTEKANYVKKDDLKSDVASFLRSDNKDNPLDDYVQMQSYKAYMQKKDATLAVRNGLVDAQLKTLQARTSKLSDLGLEHLEKHDLESEIVTFLKSSKANNPLKGYVEQKNFKYAVTTFLRSADVDNPLTEYAKKTYVDDKIKEIKGGGKVMVDLSGYLKQVDFITYKNKIQKDLDTYATASQLMTLQSNVAKDYLLKKDLSVTSIKIVWLYYWGETILPAQMV